MRFIHCCSPSAWNRRGSINEGRGEDGEVPPHPINRTLISLRLSTRTYLSGFWGDAVRCGESAANGRICV